MRRTISVAIALGVFFTSAAASFATEATRTEARDLAARWYDLHGPIAGGISKKNIEIVEIASNNGSCFMIQGRGIRIYPAQHLPGLIQVCSLAFARPLPHSRRDVASHGSLESAAGTLGMFPNPQVVSASNRGPGRLPVAAL